MEPLLAHLVGDYLLQPHAMANGKTQRTAMGQIWAVLHGLLYSLPFLLLVPSPMAWLVIFSTHVFIDHYRLANYVAKLKNWCWSTTNGYPDDTPVWLSVWLMIITDNTMHLLINYAALRWL